ncbi:MAG: glycosyltransferase [Planctomycetota bacterium]
MKILLPVHIYLPQHRAGVENYTHQLARALGERHEVMVLTTEKVISRNTGSAREYSLNGVKITAVVNNLCFDDYAESWSSAALAASFRKICDDFAPDVVHAQHLMYWSLALPRIVAEMGRPFVLTLHDYFLACGRLGQLVNADGEMCPGPSPERCAPCLGRTSWRQSERASKWIGRLQALRRATGIALDDPMRALERLGSRVRVGSRSSMPNATAAPDLDLWQKRYQARRRAFLALSEDVDLFVTPSKTLLQFMVKWGLPPNKTRQVPQGLDHRLFENSKPRTKPASGRLRLGYLGTIAPHKGLHILMEAVAKLNADEVELAIFGPASQHRKYEAELRTRFAGCSQIQFMGALPRKEIPAAYEALDLLCVPSLWNECCPLTIQEAAMARVPSLVSGIGGMAELVRDGVDGRHLAPGDVDAWESCLKELIADSSLVTAMATKTRPPIRLDEHVRTLEAIYGELKAN